MSEKNHHNSIIKNIVGEETPFILGVIFLLTIFLCSLIGLGLISGYGNMKGLELQEAMASLSSDSDASLRNFIRTNLLINHLTMFVFPSLIFTYLFYKNKWASYLRIDEFPKLYNLFLGSILILIAFPLAQLALWLNMKLPLPASLIEMEEGTAELVRNLFFVQEPYELWFNIFVIAVIPAIGEEFIFRGFVQKNIMKATRNPHIAIWIAAIIFSAIHMQFQGFLPRVVLGGILGYLFYWTGNLWVPIFAHFINNAFQIIGQYFYQKGMVDINMDETVVEINWGNTIASIILVLILSRFLMKLNPNGWLENRQEAQT